MPHGYLRQLAAPFGLMIAIIITFLLFGPKMEAWVEGYLQGAGGFAIAALCFGLLALDVLLPVPSSLVSLAAGGALGLWSGALTIWSGMTVGCLIGWAVGRGLLGPVDRKLTGARHGVPGGIWGLMLCRPVPVLAELTVLMAAARGMGLRPLALACGLANVPVALLYGGFGARFLNAAPLGYLLAGVGAACLVTLVWLWIGGRMRMRR